jgi:hypothetical protein
MKKRKKMTDKAKLSLIVLGLIISFGCGYFAKPAKIQTVTKTVEVVKEVQVATVDEKKDKKVVIDKKVNKDGTSETTTTITDNGTVSTKTDTTKDSSTSVSSSTVLTNNIGLTISALAEIDLKSISGSKTYGVHVTKRVIGNINVGVIATTDGKLGASVGMDF